MRLFTVVQITLMVLWTNYHQAKATAHLQPELLGLCTARQWWFCRKYLHKVYIILWLVHTSNIYCQCFSWFLFVCWNNQSTQYTNNYLLEESLSQIVTLSSLELLRVAEILGAFSMIVKSSFEALVVSHHVSAVDLLGTAPLLI